MIPVGRTSIIGYVHFSEVFGGPDRPPPWPLFDRSGHVIGQWDGSHVISKT
jgi:hypothetical protein